MGVSEIGFPQNVVYKQRIQTSDTLPVTIGASKYCEFLFDIDAGDRMTPLGIVGWGCDDKTQVFLLDFYMDNDLQTAKLILKNPYATTIAISSLYIDVLYSKQGLDMSEVDVVDNLTTESAVAALSARQGKLLNDAVQDTLTGQFTMLKIGTSTAVTSGDWMANSTLKIVELSFHNLQTGAALTPSSEYYVGSLVAFKPYNKIAIDVNRYNGGAAVGTLEINTNGDIKLYPLENIPTGVVLRTHVTYFYTGN